MISKKIILLFLLAATALGSGFVFHKTSLKGAPTGHALPIREIRLSSGAEFIVVVCGAIMTMPGLPRVPAADSIKLNKDGEIEGLF